MTPHELLAHSDGGQPWPAGAEPATDMAAAYRQALAMRVLRLTRGERPGGYKIGFTNRTLWQRYGVFAPMWGTVWQAGLRRCEPGRPAGRLDLGHTCEPRIEPEIVFGIARTPPAGADLQQLFECLSWLAPGFEIVQSHRPGWKFTAADTAADNGLHGRLLVGPTRPVGDLAADGARLHACLAAARVSLEHEGRVVDQGCGADVLDSPLAALQHFLVELRACPGAPELQPGDVVTTGTWTDAWPVQRGESWTAAFSEPLAPIGVRFE